MTKEIRKDIKGYEGVYKISNFGRVKSLKFGKERILKLCVSNNGYLVVNLCKNNKYRSHYVHRLVVEAFIPNPENKPEVNHINEDKINNMISNLEWCTRKYNLNYGTRRLREAISKGHKVKVIDIANGEYNYYPSIRECARQLGVNRTNIVNCSNGKVSHVGGYIFEYAN